MRTIILIFALLQSIEDTYKAANADFDAGRWAEAAVKYGLVLKEDPSHIPSRFNLAVCFTKTGKPEEAIAEYRKIVEQDGTIYEVRTNLGILPEQNGKRPEAAAQFEKAVELRPDDAQAHLNLGILYARDDQLEKAYPHLVAAEKKGLNSPDLYIALSEAEHQRKDEPKSLAYLEKASQVDDWFDLLRPGKLGGCGRGDDARCGAAAPAGGRSLCVGHMFRQIRKLQGSGPAL